ncbi:MAG: 4-hydroxythreonine-4-phosphate dehydrogenase PdxA [Archangium sp.]|nr:4-hydroxythreonine-4-phosphate dehydrogenase PdxA [Archangium sp.]
MAISAGDPSGIGPEIIAKALRHPQVRRALTPLVLGDASLARQLPGVELRAVTRLAPADRVPGKPTRRGGRAQFAYIQAAIDAVKRGDAQAVCTAPVNKGQITRAGIPFVGHTEVFAEAFDTPVLMLMEGPLLRVALATNHLPLREVPGALTISGLVAQLELLSRGLTPRLGAKPRIAVCGLNPHAGDGGALGTEERDVIAPAIRLARRRGLDVEGPFAADGLFASARTFAYDVALAMFHDQGLVATKTLDFARTVNVTLGLPHPRTSPDHGVAYDIAGKGKADEKPMVAALLSAAQYVTRSNG